MLISIKGITSCEIAAANYTVGGTRDVGRRFNTGGRKYTRRVGGPITVAT